MKTDKQDAKNIAIYCATQHPEPHKFPSLSERKLKALTRQMSYLTELVTAQQNRIQVAHEATVPHVQRTLDNLNAQIAELEHEINRHIKDNPHLNEQATLLKTIRGIGSRTIPHLLTLFGDKTFKNAKHLTSYLGLNPVVKQSGNSRTRYISISKQGDKHARTALYMPAVVCFRLPEHKSFINRLKAAGKNQQADYLCSDAKARHLLLCRTHVKTAVSCSNRRTGQALI